MTVQDDQRERELRMRFNLVQPADASRIATDAFLEVDGKRVPFELKSTTSDSVSTVRDLGPDHIAKWKGKHWIFGFYDKDGKVLQYSIYVSPEEIAPWIAEQEAYVAIDGMLEKSVPAMIDEAVMDTVLGGHKNLYTLADAVAVHKKGMTADQYRNMMDLTGGYSRARMLELLRERCRYLIARGSTRNNPHIPSSFFKGRERITDNHAERLREMVRSAGGPKA